MYVRSVVAQGHDKDFLNIATHALFVRREINQETKFYYNQTGLKRFVLIDIDSFELTESESKMAKVNPFHSKRVGTEVHHDNDKCTEGNNIESYNRVPGTGGHPKCKNCKDL